MGVKLFLWLGGFALFLGAVFFVKLSIENNWIPPEVRVALGFALGLGLVGGGLALSRKRYVVQAHTLCASGIVTLYAMTFACDALYKFEFFSPLHTFAVMALITVGAFVLAVRLDARVVAVLGMLGGFLTPVLISTGEDNPVGLFTYLALLDAGLIAVALRQRWQFLVPLGAVGTALLQIAWGFEFRTEGNIPIAMVVCLGFEALFLVGLVFARRAKQASSLFSRPVAGLAGVSLLFAWHFVSDTSEGLHPGRLFTFVFLADAAVLALAWLDRKSAQLHLAAGITVFALLGYWTMERLHPDLLPWALGFYFVFAVVHSAFPLLLQRHEPDAVPRSWAQIFPVIALLLILGPALNSATVGLAIWPAVLLLDLLAIGLAWWGAALTGVVVALILTLATAAVWLVKTPADAEPLPTLLAITAGSALLFSGAGFFLLRSANGQSNSRNENETMRDALPAFSSLSPFVLLIMASAQLPVANPTSLFGLGLLLVGLALVLTRVLVHEWLPACALAGALALTYSWHAGHFTRSAPVTPLAWYLVFYAVFSIFPFLFYRTFARARGPWIAAALAGPLFFPLVYHLVRSAWPNDVMGLLPAASALPAAAALAVVLRTDAPDDPRRLDRLALFGGTTLLFITLIFPIQFSRQWLTLAWALEGAALLWLFRRVSHRGLPIAGVILLTIAFARLALADFVFFFPLRHYASIPFGYLYTFTVVAAALFCGARLLRDDADAEVLPGFPWPALLNAFGLALLFLVVNIGIADYFKPATYRAIWTENPGGLARDMAYTVAWALYAFGLLVLGAWRHSRGARYTSLGLLGVVLLKLFFHDLSSLGQLYRIGALFAVAIIAILASFVYQRFVPAEKEEN